MRFIAIFNADASTLKSVDLDALGKKVSATFAAAGHDVSVEMPEGSALKKAIQKALKAKDVDGLIIAGGDGTVSLAASLAAGTGKALAILPGGNMNFFARSLGVPLDMDAAIEALAQGNVRAVDIACADDRPFIHEFSLGLHPEMIEERDKEKYGSRLGKIMGSLRAMSRLIVRPPRVRVWLDDGNGDRPVVASALVISNNPYGENHMPYADALDTGKLGLYVVRSRSSTQIAALAAAMQTGTWQQLEFVDVHEAKTLRLGTRRTLKAAIDGELVKMKAPVVISIRPGDLMVIAPDAALAVHGQ